MTAASLHTAFTRQAAFSDLQAAEAWPLEALMAEAARIRDAHWGRTITYSPKVFVPLTTYCRNDCGYCTFYRKPGETGAGIMTPDEVMATVRAGAAAGCREALISLGERPERRHTAAREALAELGYSRMSDYIRDICDRILAESTLLPHINAGTLTDEEFSLLKPVSFSMGMMLESTATRLMRPGGPHHACPDKAPKVRLETLRAAGRAGVPFTTGMLIGIGETWTERLATLTAINDIHREYGHIQEVIVQNFRAKPGTPMADHPEPTHNDMLRTLALARIMLDPEISLQAPPNLGDDIRGYIAAGINDWGGISPVSKDHINPERPWPLIDHLSALTMAKGYELRPRNTIYDRFAAEPGRFVAPALHARLAGMEQAV